MKVSYMEHMTNEEVLKKSKSQKKPEERDTAAEDKISGSCSEKKWLAERVTRVNSCWWEGKR